MKKPCLLCKAKDTRNNPVRQKMYGMAREPMCKTCYEAQELYWSSRGYTSVPWERG
jgi:hypothetical protein